MNQRHFVILGGGISGLSLAWFLKKNHKQSTITLIEKQSRVGGWIETKKADNFLFELGPRSCRTQGAGIETLKLIEELGLEEEVITASSAAKNRFLYLDQSLQKLPKGLFSILTSPFKMDFLKALITDLKAPKGIEEDETIFNFISRRLGTSFAHKFIDPLISGIYAGNIHELSLKSCLPLLYRWEKERGSLLKGAFSKKEREKEDVSLWVQKIKKKSIFSFKQGMQTLIDALTSQLKGNLLFNCQANYLQIEENRIKVKLDNGLELQADHLFFALPPREIEHLLNPYNSSLGALFENIPAASVAVVNLGYKKKVLKNEGFGYLIPSMEKEPILGVVWDSSVFPEQNFYQEETRLTVMLGGTQMPNVVESSEQELLKIAQNVLKKHLHIDCQPDSILIHLAKKAIPQYTLGHSTRIQQIEQIVSSLSPRLTILGNGFYGVSVNDCVKQAKKCAAMLS